MFFFALEKKCQEYMRENLRAPSKKLVLQWGRRLNLTYDEINAVSSKLSLRQQLGNNPCLEGEKTFRCVNLLDILYSRS